MNMRKTFILASALSLAMTVLQAAQPDEDSSVGTWKLDVSKSTFAQNPTPTKETRTYTATPEGTHVVIEEEFADSTKLRIETLVTYDGKPHVSVGSRDFDSVAAKRIDRNVTTADLLRDGKVIGSLRREVSPDGKTMKMHYLINKADGTTESTLSFFERQ
jgi:hypothetical protein